MNLEPPKCNANTNMCDGISNLWVFIVIGTVTPSIRKGQGCPKNCLQKYISNESYC